MHQVYNYGVIAPSTLIELADDYPQPSGYAEIAGVRNSIGGEAASSAYVLARLGVPTKLAGNRLGAGSTPTLGLLTAVGVDCSAIAHDDTEGVSEMVLSHGESRTIFGTYRRLQEARAWEEPSEADILGSRIVNVDPFFGDQSLAVARMSREHGVPYVTVDAPADSEIVRHAAVVILSREYTSAVIETPDPRQALAAYTHECQGLVIVTCGGDGAWYGRDDEPATEHPAFQVEVRDSTGAGDGFRAGIVYGLLQGRAGPDLLRVAGAVAALVCRTAPGVLGSPTALELEAFLSSRR
jgi:sugar/nucleoside kinase (ribokinase family)